MRHRSLVALGLAVGMLAACEEPWEDDFGDRWEGQHVTVYAYGLDDLDPYAPSLELLDLHTQTVMDFIGVDGPRVHTYRWMAPALVADHCPVDACTEYGVVMSPLLPDMHEATHMVLTSDVGTCQRMIAEGVATYLGERSFNAALSDAPELQITALLDYRNWQHSNEAYARAGHFIAFLAERFGGEAIAELCRGLPRASGLREWEELVPVVLDVSLAELLAQYAAYPECGVNQYRARLWECGGPPDFVFDADHRELELEFDGDEERVITSWRDPRKIRVSRRLEFTEETSLIVEVFVDGARVETARYFATEQCGSCSVDPQVFDRGVIEGWDPLDPTLEYRAGVHELILRLDERAGDSIMVRLTAVSP